MALATPDDLTVRIGLTVDEDRALALLADASATVRAYTGQQLDLVTTTDRVKVRNGRVRLPQRPVVGVTSVVDLNNIAVAHTVVGDILDLDLAVIDAWAWEPRRTGLLYVDVTYEHGYATVPADIVAVVCQIAGRAYGTKSVQSGVTAETIAGYSYQVGTAAGAGPLGLLPDERAVLDRYRRDVGEFTYLPW